MGGGSSERFSGREKRAFTFVELMVALSIVVLLALGGYAVYNGAMDRAGVSRSASNIRQLAVANLSYSVDHNGYYCPAQNPENTKRWHGGRRYVTDEFEPELGYLAPYIGVDRRQIICPLLRKVVADVNSWERGAGGYGYNATYIGGSPEDPYQPACESQIPCAARTIMFTTTAFSKKEGLQEYPFAEPFFWPAGGGRKGGDLQPSVHFRALGKALVAWCDGHVSAEPPSLFRATNFYGGNNKLNNIGWFGPEEKNGYWNPRSPAAAESKDATRGRPALDETGGAR